MARDVAPFKVSDLHVQGAGVPISVGMITPVATLRIAHVAALVEDLELDDQRRLKLIRQIHSVMARYLGRRLMNEQTASHAATLKLLPQIAKSCDTLASQLTALDPGVLCLFEDNRNEAADAEQPPFLDIVTLVRKLKRLGRAVERTRGLMKPNPRGRKEAGLLEGAVAELVSAIESADLPVEAVMSGSAYPRRQVHGPGGELLLKIFHNFSRHDDEPKIVGAIMRSRSVNRRAKQ